MRAGRDLIWNMNHSRVAENILITAALRCLPSHVTRHPADRASSVGAGVAAALRQLRQMCQHTDTSIACRVPDARRCHGCETGDLSPVTPLEHCCGDSCPSCNISEARCMPSDVYFGDPLISVRLTHARPSSRLSYPFPDSIPFTLLTRPCCIVLSCVGPCEACHPRSLPWSEGAGYSARDATVA